MLIPKLETKATDSWMRIESKQKKELVVKDLEIMHRYIIEFEQKYKLPFPNKDSLVYEHYSEKVSIEIVEYLDVIRKYFQNEVEKVKKERDRLGENLLQEMGGNEAVASFKNNYRNEKLRDLVLNKGNKELVETVDGLILQQNDPIYMIPTNNYGRALLYSSQKKFLGFYFDTITFNILFIWFTSAFLYLLLIVDGFRRFLDFLGGISIIKKHK